VLIAQELTKSEQALIWDQGFIDAKHPIADKVLSIAEALKTSGYDLATILGIMKGIQNNPYSLLPKYFSIVNNKYLVVPYIKGPNPNKETSHKEIISDMCIFNLNDGSDTPLVDLPDEPKLMALTFWLK
jgi:hypothetical protein